MFSINKSFAANYDKRRANEELQKFGTGTLRGSVRSDSENTSPLHRFRPDFTVKNARNEISRCLLSMSSAKIATNDHKFFTVKDKYGSAAIETELNEPSSSEESEDDDGQELTPAMEKQWLKSYAAVKLKHPSIYDPDKRFFAAHPDDESERPLEGSSSSRDIQRTAVTIRDHEREFIMRGGGLDESDSDHDGEITDGKSSLAYDSEQLKLKKELLAAAEEQSGGGEDDVCGFLTRRIFSDEQREKEESDYTKWLNDNKKMFDADTENELAPLKKFWMRADTDRDEIFLRDYVLNKRYLEKDASRMPTYDEVVESGAREDISVPSDAERDTDSDVSEEDEILKRQDAFERKYNFRFQEADFESKKYARDIPDSMRHKESSRAEKRAEYRARKEKEKEEYKADLREMQCLKSMTNQHKVDRIRSNAGLKGDAVCTADDLDKDFDPEAHNQLMQRMFGGDDDADADADVEKPVFSDLSDIEGVDDEATWNSWQPSASVTNINEEDSTAEAGDLNKAAAVEEDEDDDDDYAGDIPQVRSRKRKRPRSRFAKAAEKKKPTFTAGQDSVSDYLKKHYDISCEDVVSGMPCRFKYRSVPANDYGLSIGEVLMCDDRELNKWISMKRISRYATEEDEEHERRSFKKKAKNEQFKLNILPSLRPEDGNEQESGDDEDEKPPPAKLTKAEKRRMRKKKRAADDAILSETNPPREQTTAGEKQTTDPKRAVDGLDNELEVERHHPMKKLKIAAQASSVNDSHSSARTANPGNDQEKSPAETNPPTQKRKRKKKPKQPYSAVTDSAAQNASKSPKPEKGNKSTHNKNWSVSDERLRAYGINPKKFKYTKHKFVQNQ